MPASAASGASAPEVARIRSEWYACMRTCSHSAEVRGPGFSQIVFEMAARPTSCRWPATSSPSRVRASSLTRLPAAVARRATAAE